MKQYSPLDVCTIDVGTHPALLKEVFGVIPVTSVSQFIFTTGALGGTPGEEVVEGGGDGW
jgi:hypothetical protein